MLGNGGVLGVKLQKVIFEFFWAERRPLNGVCHLGASKLDGALQRDAYNYNIEAAEGTVLKNFTVFTRICNQVSGDRGMLPPYAPLSCFFMLACGGVSSLHSGICMKTICFKFPTPPAAALSLLPWSL